MVLAKAKTGESREHRDIVIHVGTNDVRMKQSEITKLLRAYQLERCVGIE